MKNSKAFFLFFSHQVFDSTGSFLSYINTSADPLYGPQGLALTSDGHVAVADSGNHCFKVYRYLQQTEGRRHHLLLVEADATYCLQTQSCNQSAHFTEAPCPINEFPAHLACTNLKEKIWCKKHFQKINAILPPPNCVTVRKTKISEPSSKSPPKKSISTRNQLINLTGIRSHPVMRYFPTIYSLPCLNCNLLV